MGTEIEENAITRLEELALNAWPAIKTIYHDGAILRLAEGFTKRSNSVNALYRVGDIDELIGFAENVYARNALPTIFKMIELPSYDLLDRRLESSGYIRIDPTSVLTAGLVEQDFPAHDEVMLADGFSREWIDGFISANRLEARSDAVRKILDGIAVGAVVASAEVEGRPIAFGFGALEAGWAGFFDIFVRQDHRGKGYGRKIMEALLGAAKERGAANGYLQVMDHNLPARALYGKLGFKRAYGYWYRKRDARGPTGPQ